MKKLYKLLMVAIIATMGAAPAFAQSEQQLRKERVISSYMITFGRQPGNAELNYWVGQGNISLSQLVSNHNQYLQSNTEEKKKVIIRAFEDSYGYKPSAEQVKQNLSSSNNYTQWIANHTAYLKSNTAAWNDMIAKVYWNVCKRWATDNDRKSWKQSEAKPYMLVAAVVDEWNKKNSWFSTWFISNNSSYVSMANISNPVANEVARLIGQAGGNVIAAGGGNVIAPGGANVVAAGGGNVIAAGGGN